MQNEADSVDDAIWAAETRWEARRRSVHWDAVIVLVVMAFLTWFYWWLWLGIVRCDFHTLHSDSFGCWARDNREWIYSPANSMLFVLLGLFFGFLNVRGRATALFLLNPAFAIAGAVLVQTLAPPVDLSYVQNGVPTTLNLLDYTYRSVRGGLRDSVQLTALVLLGLWLGQRLRLRRLR